MKTIYSQKGWQGHLMWDAMIKKMYTSMILMLCDYGSYGSAYCRVQTAVGSSQFSPEQHSGKNSKNWLAIWCLREDIVQHCRDLHSTQRWDYDISYNAFTPRSFIRTSESLTWSLTWSAAAALWFCYAVMVVMVSGCIGKYEMFYFKYLARSQIDIVSPLAYLVLSLFFLSKQF